MATLGQTLDDMGYEHNRVQSIVGYNSSITNPEAAEDAVTVANGLEGVTTELTNIDQMIPPSGLAGDRIEYLEVEKLRAGTIYSQKIFMNVFDGRGDIFIAANKTDFNNTQSGFILGIDDSDSNRAKFYIGDSSNYLNWDGSTLIIAGSLVAGEIHIPNVNTTANSFHVGSDGSGWIGATSTNRATAPIQWTAAGVWDVGNVAGTYIRINGPAGTIGTTNFSTGVAGWQINKDGSAEFENIKARGSLYGTTFKYDVVSAVGGQLLVTSADSLSTAMTALDSSTLTIVGNTTFAANAMLLIRAVTASGIQEEYLRVTSAASAPTYTVTRDLAAAYGANANPAWGAGTAVVKIGVSDGAATYSGGWLRLLGEGTNAPHYSIFSRTGVAYNSYAERGRIGNLNGIGSVVTEAYGIFMGNYTANKYFQYDDASGNLVINGLVNGLFGFGGDGSDGALSVGAGVTTTLNLDQVYNYSSISVNATGTLTFTGSGGAYLNCSGNAAINGTIELRNMVTTLTSGGTIRDNLQSGTAMTSVTLSAGGTGGAGAGTGGTSTTASGTPGVGGATGADGSGGNSSVGGGGGGGATGTGATAGATTATSDGGAGGAGGTTGSNGGGGGGGGYNTGNGGLGGTSQPPSGGGTGVTGGNGGSSGSNGGTGGAGGLAGNASGNANGGVGGVGGPGYTAGGNGGQGGQGGSSGFNGGSGGVGGVGRYGTGGVGGTGGAGSAAGSGSGGVGGTGGTGRTGGAGGTGGGNGGGTQGGAGGTGGAGQCGSTFFACYVAGTLDVSTMTINAQGGDGGAGGSGGGSNANGGAGGAAGDGADVIMVSLGACTGSFTCNNVAGTPGAGGARTGTGTAGATGASGSPGVQIVAKIKQTL